MPPRPAGGWKTACTARATRLKLALLLYDGRHYPEALAVLKSLESAPDSSTRFFSLVWQGHLADLAGKRDEAVSRYRAALKVPGNPTMQHGQYRMTIDEKWVRERLRAPFTR